MGVSSNVERTLGTLRDRQEDAGHKALAVVGLLKDGDLLAKTRTGGC